MNESFLTSNREREMWEVFSMLLLFLNQNLLKEQSISGPEIYSHLCKLSWDLEKWKKKSECLVSGCCLQNGGKKLSYPPVPMWPIRCSDPQLGFNSEKMLITSHHAQQLILLLENSVSFGEVSIDWQIDRWTDWLVPPPGPNYNNNR